MVSNYDGRASLFLFSRFTKQEKQKRGSKRDRKKKKLNPHDGTERKNQC